ncbi:hypothetical protein V8E36_003214 [Tilletia maclaganii]
MMPAKNTAEDRSSRSSSSSGSSDTLPPNRQVPYSQYDIVDPIPITTADACASAAQVAARNSSQFRSLQSALQSLINGTVLHREDMPAAPSSQPPTAAAAPSAFSTSALPTSVLAHPFANDPANNASPGQLAFTIPPNIETFVSSTRIFNSAAPVAAYLVALPQSTADVAAILRFCSSHGLSPSVKSGGYATAGWSVQGDIVIDLSRMNSVDVVRPQDFYAEKHKAKRAKRSFVNEGPSRTRKADEAFAATSTDAASAQVDDLTMAGHARKRVSPSATLSLPALRRITIDPAASSSTASVGSGHGSGSGTGSTSPSGEGTMHSGTTDATSEQQSSTDSMNIPLASPSIPLSKSDSASSGGGEATSSISAPASSNPASTPSPHFSARTSVSTSDVPTTRSSAAQLRTGLADHLSWQRHHRPDGRASTHERVVLPESGPFVWRAAGPNASVELGGGGGGDAMDESSADSVREGSTSSASSSLAPPAPAQQQSPQFPLAAGPPSAFHAARAPSALLPMHSHEQPWQEARYRQQIEESALHHRQTVAGGVPSQTGMVYAAGSSGSGAGPWSGLSVVGGGGGSGVGTGTGVWSGVPFGSKFTLGPAGAAFPGGAAPGGLPTPSGLPSFLPPYTLSPEALHPQMADHPPHPHHHRGGHAQTSSPTSSPVALRPGIYTRPYLLAVFGPGVGVRALDLATDEAGRTNSWDRAGWADAEMPLSRSPDCPPQAGGADDEEGDDSDVPPTPDWDEPIRSTPYHCPLSAYPVGSTAMTTGGFGYISRAYGLSLDNVVEVEMVLADGRVVVLNEGSKKRSKEEAELWWAVRGAAPCFGVVTKIVAKAYPIPSCFSGNLIFPFNPATAPSLIKHWRDCLKGALPREMYTNLILVAGPNPSAHVIMIQICLLQSAAKGETFVQAIASWTGERMLLKDVEERPFLAQQDGVAQVLKGGGGRRWIIRGDTLEILTDELISQSVQRFKNATANRGVWLFELVNGAIVDNAEEEDEEREEGDVEMKNADAGAAADSQAPSGLGQFTIPPLVESRPGPSTTADAQPRVTKETCLAPSLRRAQFMVGALQQWEDHDEDRACVVLVDHWLRDAVSPISIGGPLPSFLERSETRERIASTFGERNLEKLIRVKRAVDPRGLFRHTFGAGLSGFAGCEELGGAVKPGSNAALADSSKVMRIP